MPGANYVKHVPLNMLDFKLSLVKDGGVFSAIPNNLARKEGEPIPITRPESSIPIEKYCTGAIS